MTTWAAPGALTPTDHLPRILYQTHVSRDLVPTHIDDAVQRFAADYVHEFYDDERCLAFLAAEYGDRHVETYRRLKLGAHKADFWRYCVLYVRGGVYMDIKTELTRPLNDIFERRGGAWYCVLGAWCGSFPAYLHNGVIASPAGNPVLKAAIEHILETPNEVIDANYFCFVQELYRLTETALGHPPRLGENLPGPESGGLALVLLDEVQRCEPFRARPDMRTLRNRRGESLRSEAPLVMCLGFEIAGQSGETLLRTSEGSFPWRPGTAEPRHVGLGTRVVVGLVHTLFTLNVRLNRRFFLLTRMRNAPGFRFVLLLFQINNALNPMPRK